MQKRYILISLTLIVILLGFKVPQKNILNFKTSKGHLIKVYKKQIFYDDAAIFKRKYDDDILYNDKSNRILEDHGVTFLFLAIDGRPNNDEFEVYSITSSKATLVANTVISAVKDYDNDGYLEFGGRDLTEGYDNPDSMYYIPTAYYEIKNGKIHPDDALTKKEDIKINGLYLPPSKQLDANRNCCKVILVPGRKPSTHTPKKSDFYIKKSFMGSDTISVFVSKAILEGKDDILMVKHFPNGAWYIYGKETVNGPMNQTKLGDVVKLDNTILLLSWVPKGYIATRSSKTAPWGWNILK